MTKLSRSTLHKGTPLIVFHSRHSDRGLCIRAICIIFLDHVHSISKYHLVPDTFPSYLVLYFSTDMGMPDWFNMLKA